MSTFEYVSSSPRVIFGKGTLTQIPSLVGKLGVKSVMILSTPEQTEIAQRVADILGVVAVSNFSGAVMHTPTHITELALSQVKQSGVDGVVSVGGGSTIGLGKAISVRTGLVHICIPTTYAGSEMTPILGETENGRKVTRRDAKILPTAVVYDVDLTLTLPIKMSVHSGINAIAHSGGSFNLPHAETHVVVLPHAVAFNASSAPQAMAQLAAALPESHGDAVRGINALYRRLGVDLSLQKLGMLEENIDKAADIAVSNPYHNPRPLERDALREVIRRAWKGEKAFQDL
ncbi:hypothetical protein NW762_012013 [Fusarium torreyae]|uniref:Alcohol dehydrogenase iron-type/glycerol dehydrogenase GldA domain-containing protein n=1 Tax=Fusarium torreyae TaxID=1237075 RepID=A0A9W8VA21_9HYPO|nr:hypothetical protein NW762_012013 [Fusarium torreyae]